MGGSMKGIPDEEFMCCDTLKDHFSDICEQHGIDCPDLVINYHPNTRSFTLAAKNATYNAYFCPWCGKEFPKDLINEFHDLSSNFIDLDVWSSPIDEWPEELRSDEWWKKENYKLHITISFLTKGRFLDIDWS